MLLDTSWMKQAFSTVFNSTSSSVKKSHKQKLENDEDYLEVPEMPKGPRKKSHPKVGTLSDLEAFEPWYWTIEYGYAWIAGYRPYLYWANTTNCFNRMSNFTYIEIPEFQRLIARPRFSMYD